MAHVNRTEVVKFIKDKGEQFFFSSVSYLAEHSLSSSSHARSGVPQLEGRPVQVWTQGGVNARPWVRP